MGNICGKQDDPYAQPGRRVGDSSASATNPSKKTVPVPKKVGGPGRTLGGSTSGDSGSAGADEARRRAAEAAEARAAKGSGKPAGKLQTQLNQQKKQNRSETLKEASSQEVRTREADEAARARNWE